MEILPTGAPRIPTGLIALPESQPLDFHSPYGCSKGAGDQYVRDYARIYDLPTVVFRQSCIYGLRQFGVEDQGWLAHFVIATAKNRPINIYGDGKQVRDLVGRRPTSATSAGRRPSWAGGRRSPPAQASSGCGRGSTTTSCSSRDHLDQAHVDPGGPVVIEGSA